MDFTTIIDISSMIWDRADYNANTQHYYEIADSILVLLERLENQNTKYLIREELIDRIQVEFPFWDLPNDFNDFRSFIYSFLSKIGSKRVDYLEIADSNLVSTPEVVKEYYTDETKEEVKYLVTRVHSQEDTNGTYFSFKYLWDENFENLITSDGTDDITHQTIISDKKNDLDEFLDKFKRIFEHNPKHDRITGHKTHGGEEVAILSCFDGQDTTKPQELLDDGIKVGERIYNYDDENEVYVIFMNHHENKYHGFDETDRERIPYEVRKHFNK